MKITNDDAALIDDAAADLDGCALELRMAHTRGTFEANDWTGEEIAKAEYDRMKRSVEQLYALAERMRAGVTA